MNVKHSRRSVAAALALALLAAPAAAHSTPGGQTASAARPNVIVRLPHAITQTRLLAAGGLTVRVHTDQPGQVLVGVQDAGRRERGFAVGATRTPGWVRLKVNLARARSWAVGNRVHVHVTVHPVGDPGSRARLVDRWVHVTGSTGSPPRVLVHAIFGGHGAHVGQILYVVPSHGKMTQLCWDPAPIDRPACSRARMGAPSTVGKTRLIMRLADGSLLSRVIRVTPAYTRTGGHGGSDAVAGHVGCPTVTLTGNPGPRGYEIGTLTSGAAIAIYNRVRGDIFVWHYADNAAGF
ncbi:MAG: hypothetical protein ACJ786_30405, partial [Catenulispora sp.]